MAETKELPKLEETGEVNEKNVKSNPPSRSKWLKSRWRLYAILGALILVVIGIFLWRYFGSYESTDDAQVDVHIYPVSARISGHVLKVNVGDNQYVKKGEVLVEIDPKDYEVAVDKARAELASAEASAQALKINVPITSVSTSSQLSSTASDVQSANAGILVAQKQASAATAQLQQAEANAVRAQDDVNRYKQLVDKKEISEQVYERAHTDSQSAAAAVEAARANASAAEHAVEQAKGKLAQAEANHRSAGTAPQQVESTNARARSAAADVQQKRAQVEQAELNLQYTKIIAPNSGMVRKDVVVGMNIQPGQQLLVIVPLDEVWVTANFKETQLKHTRPGQKAEVKVDSNGKIYKGHVDSIAGATGPLFSLFPPENATGNYVKIVQRIPVKIVLEAGENHDLQLRPGMNVEPKVIIR